MKINKIAFNRQLLILAFLSSLFFFCNSGFSQGVSINETNTPPDPSAMLDVQSTSKGFLPPRLTAEQRINIQNPAPGLVVFDTGSNALFLYSGDDWMKLEAGEKWILGEDNNLSYDAGNVGIGILYPSALLHVHGVENGDGSVLFTGQYKSSLPGIVPASGSGTRLMWHPDKAVFRAGRVNGTQWNNENVGDYSSAFGFNSIASNTYAMAWGDNTTAAGPHSTAFGWNTNASGFYATAFGSGTIAPSTHETVIGRNNTIYTPQGGSNTWNSADRLFVIGNGASISDRGDALVLLKNGNMGLNTSTPTQRLEVAGSIYAQTSNWAIRGVKTGTTGTFPGIWGETESGSVNANGIRGFALNTTSGTGSAGVFGKNFSTTNVNYGVYGESVSVSGRGVYGLASATTGTNYGVYGQTKSFDGSGVFGLNTYTDEDGYGVYGKHNGDGYGVYGEAISLPSSGTGGYFRGGYTGVFARVNSTITEYVPLGLYGVRSQIETVSSMGLIYAGHFIAQSQNNNTYAIYASAQSAFSSVVYAGYFNGNVTVTGTITNPSDQMFKRNITAMDSSLEKVLQLKGRTYQNKTDEYRFMNLPAGLQYGFIAQELEEVFPELVNDNLQPGTDPRYDKDSEHRESLSYKGINYIGLIPILTEAIKEQQKMIEAQKAEIDELKKLALEIEEIKAILNNN